MKVLLVSGVSSRTQYIISNLERLGFEITEWTFAKSQSALNQIVPKEIEAVFVLVDFLSHSVAENLAVQASKRGIHFLRMPHRWAFIYQELTEKRLIFERPTERIEMGAPLDKAPEALVVGGYLADRAEVYSRMISCGWKVKDHWLSNEGGHVYNKARNGIKMIVVMRDSLENTQYQQAHTLAQLSRVPIIKWDINRELFRRRLQEQNLLYQPIQVPAPEPAALKSIEPAPIIPGVTPGYDEGLLGQTQVETIKEAMARPITTATAAFDSLIAKCAEILEELHTNPMFRGVNIRVQDDGSAEVIPIARPFKLGATSVHAAQKAVETPPPPQLLSTAADPASSKASTFVGPGLVGSHDPSDRSIQDPTLEVPKTPPPRPVFQPVPPKYEEPARKPRVVGRSGRGKGYLKGKNLNMDCRFPGCKTRSLGPRFGFMCKAHQDIPAAQKKEYQKLFNIAHPM